MIPLRTRRNIYLSIVLFTSPAMAGTSNWIGPGSDFGTAANWSAGVPNDIAGFNSATPTDIAMTNMSLFLTGIVFNGGASAYTLTLNNSQLFSNLPGQGIVNNSPNTQTIVSNGGTITLQTTGVTNTGGGDVLFTNNGVLNFTAGTGGTIQNISNGEVYFGNASSAGSKSISNSGKNVTFNNTSTASNATISNSALLEFNNTSTAGSASITNTGASILRFQNSATAGNATISNGSLSTLYVNGTATLGSATVSNEGSIDASNLGVGAWTVGSISGSGNLLLGATRLTIGSNDLSTTLSGTVSGGGGSLTKVGNGTLTLSGTNTYSGTTNINGGTLLLTGSMASNVIVGSSGYLGGTGTLGTLVNNGHVAPGSNGSGTLTMSGYSGGGAIDVAFSGTSHGSLRVTGSSDLTGGTLNITGTTFAVGQYRILTAGTLSGTLTTVNGPASLFTATPLYSATDLSVLINFATPFASFAQTTNQSHVAEHLSGAKESSTADFTNAISALSLLSSAEIPQAFQQISGDALATFQQVSLTNAAQFTQGMRQRLIHVSTSSYGLWAEGVRFMDNRKGNVALGSPASYAASGGFQAGYDTAFAEHVRVGFSGGYVETSVDVGDRASAGNAKSMQSGLYASYYPGRWFMNGSVAYIGETHEMKRLIAFGSIRERANATFDSRLITTAFQAGYSIPRRDTLSIEPSLSLRQTRLLQDGFSETGAPGLGLAVADRSEDSWVSSVGSDVRQQYFPQSKHPLTLKAGLAWEHEFADTSHRLSAHFSETTGGRDFTVEGTPKSRNAAVLGFEGRVPLQANLDLSLTYAATVASQGTEQSLSGGIRLTW